jgi:hypothetical protein
MWYDTKRRQAMLYVQGKTYALSTNNEWVELLTSSPAIRFEVTLAYDPKRHEALLFGSTFDNPPSVDLTWVWNGSEWTLKHPLHEPTNRGRTAMAYDPTLGGIVLFGGDEYVHHDRNIAVYKRDTWLWNGLDWTQLDLGATLPPISGDDPQTALGYDGLSSTLFLVMGTNRTHILTYTWNSGTWELQKQAVGKQAQPNCVIGSVPLRLVYDSGRGYLLLLVAEQRGGYHCL